MKLPSANRSESALKKIAKLMTQSAVDYVPHYKYVHPDITIKETKKKKRLAKITTGSPPREGKAKKESKVQK